MRSFPGFVEIGVLRPAENIVRDESEWGLVLHFDSGANLKNWGKLPERKHRITLADSFSVAEPEVERSMG